MRNEVFLTHLAACRPASRLGCSPSMRFRLKDALQRRHAAKTLPTSHAAQMRKAHEGQGNLIQDSCPEKERATRQ